MDIYPAIDLYQGKAVRLYKGDYAQMTVYSEDPPSVARDFAAAGARHIHLVDLEGAKSGKPENLSTIRRILEAADLFAEVGGDIRNLETVEQYLSCGVNRVILGTAAVKDPDFLKEALNRCGEKIAVGVDLKDGFVAIKGWTEHTDISRDGAMKGTNLGLYRKLSGQFGLDLIASGGVSSLEDVKALREMNLSGAIIGKAYYIGAIDLKEAVEAAT